MERLYCPEICWTIFRQIVGGFFRSDLLQRQKGTLDLVVLLITRIFRDSEMQQLLPARIGFFWLHLFGCWSSLETAWIDIDRPWCLTQQKSYFTCNWDWLCRHVASTEEAASKDCIKIIGLSTDRWQTTPCMLYLWCERLLKVVSEPPSSTKCQQYLCCSFCGIVPIIIITLIIFDMHTTFCLEFTIFWNASINSIELSWCTVVVV